jgi:GTP:adenosylcobinamide-phosphate guanylyltransferase
MDAILSAGGIPQPGEPLYDFTRGEPKAMLDICGKPMVQWVLDALEGAQSIEQIVVIGLGPEHNLQSSKIRAYIPNQGGMLANVRVGMKKLVELKPQVEYVLFVSSDIPAITAEMVDWVVNTALETRHDAYYNVIRRDVMEARYPTSRRSYLRLKDLEVCGGDMNVLRANMGPEHDRIWERIINSRKSVFRQAALIGFDTLFMVLFHLVTLERGVQIASRRLGLKGRAVVCPYPEVGMDVDKPFQLEIMRADLERRVLA